MVRMANFVKENPKLKPIPLIKIPRINKSTEA